MAGGDGTNPILYIEDLYRMPLRRRRIPAAGAVQVYLSRNGRLHCPAGGLTLGELWWLAPRRVYEGGGGVHPLELSYDLSGASMPIALDRTLVRGRLMESLMRWVADHAQILVVAAAVVVVYLVLRTLLRTVVPWLIRMWLVPLAKVPVVVVALVLLGIQVLAAAPFRAMKVKPPALVYAAG